MKSFNIFGACVSRDIFPVDTTFEVNQYVSFTSPLSLYLKRDKREDVTLLDRELFDGLKVGSNFAKRCMRLDSNNCSLDYLIEKKSDYLILDLADYRFDVIQFANTFFTKTLLYDQNGQNFTSYFETNGGFKHLKIFDEKGELEFFSQEELLSSLEWFCSEILKSHSVDKIILHEYYLCDKYVNENGKIEPFSASRNIQEVNALLKKLYDRCKELLKGCYRITSPDNVIGNRLHKWGVHPLHFVNEYYEYAHRSLELICEDKKQEDIDQLRDEYSELIKRSIQSYKVTDYNFIDVSATKAWYYKAVYWGAQNGVVTGTDRMFFPDKNCTREQALIFLWRMAGRPEPKSTKNAFLDLKDTMRTSYKAIMWGSEKGIVTGLNGRIYPTSTCTREQIITMLWRYAGKPQPKSDVPKFSDVKNGSYAYKAIIWASEKGIARGSNGKFSPKAICKRKDIVTFLYRYKN